MNKWGVMKVAGDEMKELEVNVPRLKVELLQVLLVGCYMVGRLDELMALKKQCVC